MITNTYTLCYSSQHKRQSCVSIEEETAEAKGSKRCVICLMRHHPPNAFGKCCSRRSYFDGRRGGGSKCHLALHSKNNCHKALRSVFVRHTQYMLNPTNNCARTACAMLMMMMMMALATRFRHNPLTHIDL